MATMELSSDEKVVLITGGTGGLGSAVAPAFANAGWRVALTDLDPSTLARHTDGLRAGVEPRSLVGRRVDVTDTEQVAHLIAAIEQVHGRLDALLNLVGGYAAGHKVGDLNDLTVWQQMWELNLLSTLTVCWAAIPALRRNGWGRIVNVGSRNALQGTAKAAAYAASKAAVVNLTQALAAEEREHNITANVLLPGTIDTPANRQAMPKADFSKWVTSGQLAGAMLFLCSPAADAISGAAIPIYNRS